MNKRERRKKFKHNVNKIMKLLSYAIIVVLVFLGIFFSYYFVSLKIYEKNPETNVPKFGLYTIISYSMHPSIKVYDVVVTATEKAEDIKVGDRVEVIYAGIEGVVVSVDSNTCMVSYITENDKEIVETYDKSDLRKC